MGLRPARRARRRLPSRVAGRPAEEVSRLLADRGIFASHGNFYAMTVVERLGLADHGLVRLGCACYTTRRRSRSGHRSRAMRLRGRETCEINCRFTTRTSLLREFGMRVQRVEVLVPDRVEEAVERHGPRSWDRDRI